MSDRCRNCGTALRPDDRFCPQCGQETADHSQDMRVFMQHFLSDYFTFDSKLFRSVLPLLFRPGFLTNEYLRGRRVSYIAPLRMYLFVSLIFFLILGLQGKGTDDEMDRFFETHLPRLFFFLLPLFALILRLLYLKRVKNFVTHFLFALHFHTFLFLSGFVLMGINTLIGAMNAIAVTRAIAGVFGVAWMVYLIVAQNRVYQDRGAKLLLRFLALMVLYLLLFAVGSLVVLLLVTEGGQGLE